MLEAQYAQKCRETSDIHEHLPTLREYASRGNSVVECGVRAVVSSYAFACALKGKTGALLTLIDPVRSPNVESFRVECEKEGLATQYFEASDLDCPLVEADLVFIDTWHVYAQLKRELHRWHVAARKYIALHDTTVDEWHGETIRNKWDAEAQSKESGFPVDEIRKGLWPAVSEFLAQHPEWTLEARYTNNNGLTILRRV